MGTTSRETPATGQATSNYSSLMPGFPSPTSGTLRRVSSYVTPLCISPTTRSETEWVMGLVQSMREGFSHLIRGRELFEEIDFWNIISFSDKKLTHFDKKICHKIN